MCTFVPFFYFPFLPPFFDGGEREKGGGGHECWRLLVGIAICVCANVCECLSLRLCCILHVQDEWVANLYLTKVGNLYYNR